MVAWRTSPHRRSCLADSVAEEVGPWVLCVAEGLPDRLALMAVAWGGEDQEARLRDGHRAAWRQQSGGGGVVERGPSSCLGVAATKPLAARCIGFRCGAGSGVTKF